ncbi:TPA: KxYKxGKxW signal peptide domain-containing protein, partial [Streptococcus suis]
MKMQRKDDFTEVSRKSRVKMHKSGKHWVRTVMSQIGLMRIGGKSSASSAEVNLATVKRSMTASQLLRGLAAAGAVVGGNVSVETVMASEVVATSETSASTLAEADTVVLTTVVDSDSVSVSSSESTSISESASQSESTSASGSTSLSESESLSSSESVSNSESQSASESLSVSESTSVSHSESESGSTTTSSSTSSETSTSESAASETAASETGSETSASETGTTTVEEEKQTLEQVISEAEVLVQIASNQTAPSQALLTAIETSRDQILLAQTILGDADATVADLATIISSLQSSNQAIGLLLLENDEDGVITFALDTATTATVTKVGEGYGVLVDTLSTATPEMTDAKGAKVSDLTFSSPYAGTSVAGWHTFSYTATDTYDQNHKSSGGTALNAYIRYSLDEDTSTYTVLAELVSKTGTVLESYKIDPGSSATFTYPSTLDTDNSPITITYDTSLATASGIPGGLRFSTSSANVYGTTLVPTYTLNTTYYKTTDGTIIATYSVMTIGGQTVTPSGVRSFVGYDYSTTTNATSTRALTPGTTYMHGKVEEQGTKTLITVIDDQGTIKRSLYYRDPTYTGTVDWNGTDTTGFIKLFETSEIKASTSTSGTNYNTYSTIEPSYTTTTHNGQRIMVFYTSPAQNWRLIGYWTGGTAQGGTQYGRFFFGRQSLDRNGNWGLWQANSSSTGVNDYGTQYGLGNPLSTLVNETTHWYTVDTSESESLSNSNSHSLSESESTSNSESTSKSESISNSESLSNSESTSNSESISNSISESVRESVSESISESVKESVSESISESVKESVSESISESVKESVSESVSESVRESVSESVSESVKESVSES